jgi:hypothetical protein
MIIELPKELGRIDELHELTRALVMLTLEKLPANCVLCVEDSLIPGHEADYIDIIRDKAVQTHGVRLRDTKVSVYEITKSGRVTEERSWELTDPNSLAEFERWLRHHGYRPDRIR